jgi:PAS domain-containing protein
MNASSEQHVPNSFESDLLELEERLKAARAVSDLDDSVLLEDLETAYEELRTADEEVRAQREQIARLLSSESMLRWQHDRMLAAIPLPVVITDRFGVVRSVNTAAAALLQMRVAHVLGKPVVSLFDAKDSRHLRDVVSSASDRLVAVGAMALHTPRGGITSVELTVLPTAGESSHLTWLMSPLPEAASISAAAPRLPQALAAIAAFSATDTDIQHVLQKIADVTQAALGADLVVSVSLGPPESPETLASTGQIAQATDGAQMQAGEGPCVTAFHDMTMVVSDDLHRDSRWPRLAPLVPPEVHGALAVPLEVGPLLVGALNFYRTSPASLSPLIEPAELTAVTVAAVLHERGVRADLDKLAADMEAALKSRAVIDQAKGIVMAHRGCDATEAFAHLVHLSSTQQKKLREVAQELVDRAASAPGLDL